MERPQTPFKLPSIGELKSLTEAQLRPIFFALEQHRAQQLLVASNDYTDRLHSIEQNYTSDFKVLSDVLAEVRSKTA